MTVSLPLVVDDSVLKVVVVEPDGSTLVSRGTHVDHPATAAGSWKEQFRHDQVGEQEMTNVVRGELSFDPFWGRGERVRGHDPGIVDQNVNLFSSLVDFSCRLSDASL